MPFVFPLFRTGALSMKNWSFVLFALLVTPIGHTENKPLKLELDSSTFYDDEAKNSTWMYDENHQTSEHQQSAECKEMRKQIQGMKSKPQRKFALQQRYDAVCLK